MNQFLEIDEAALVRAQQDLEAFMEPQMTKVMRGTARAGAKVLVGPLQAATPIKDRAGAGTGGFYTSRSGIPRSYGNPGDMRNSIRLAWARGSASRGGIAYVVGPFGKRAFMRHWVTAGTKPHIIQGAVGHKLRLPFGARAIVHHPGARANPYIARIGREQQGAVRAAMLAYIASQAKKARRAGATA